MMQNQEKKLMCLTRCITVLSLVMSMAACHRITLTAIEAPISSLSDWQAVTSNNERVTYTAPAGKVIVYKSPAMLTQVRPDLAKWFDGMLTSRATRVMNEPSVEKQRLGKRHADAIYAIVKTPEDTWRRYEAYLLADRLIWVDVDSNIDSKSYEEMMTFLTGLVD